MERRDEAENQGKRDKEKDLCVGDNDNRQSRATMTSLGVNTAWVTPTLCVAGLVRDQTGFVCAGNVRVCLEQGRDITGDWHRPE
jgi:hypothetical protein